MQFRLLATIGLLFFIVSCGSNKKTNAVAEVSKISKSSLYKKHEKQSFQNSDIQTLRIDAKLAYKAKKSSQKVGLKMRIAKGEKIWMSGDFLGISVAKVLIKKDSVFYYNKFDKTYFKGSFDFIKQIVGADVNFETLERLLLGDLIIYNKKFKYYDLEIIENAYFLTDSKDSKYTKKASIYPLIFKTKYQSIESNLTQSIFEAFYKNHQEIDNFLFPKKVEFRGNNSGNTSVISMDYQKIYVNPKLGFPFKIPSSCNKEIKLKPKS
ncbi:DUF4292 domain-containing protein [Wenyingzhuangia sp. IMCC45574]